VASIGLIVVNEIIPVAGLGLSFAANCDARHWDTHLTISENRPNGVMLSFGTGHEFAGFRIHANDLPGSQVFGHLDHNPIGKGGRFGAVGGRGTF